MKRAFTLVELMIVIAVMVVLMSLVFKITGVGNDAWRRAETVSRLQRLENCLSGYNAAFGNYPPVKLHGSRDYRRRVDIHGIQEDSSNEGIWNWNKIGEYSEMAAWNQVQAACRAQPVDCRFPYPEGFRSKVDFVSAEMKRRANSGDEHYRAYWENEDIKERLSAGFDDGVSDNIGRHASKKDYVDWREIQLFKFGLMSYLLPRYLVMMNGDQVFFTQYAQWKENNELPADPYTGKTYTYWTDIKSDVDNGSQQDLGKLANIPTQAACARWTPNLAGICRANRSIDVFGTDITDTTTELRGGELDPDNVNIQIFAPNETTGGQYVLDGVTVVDGWLNEFYYYSPAPYQRYTLWSAGPNGRTFPPWVDRNSDSLGGNSQRCISLWVADDIIKLKN